MGASLNSEHSGLFWPYLPNPTLESCTIFFMDSLFFRKPYIKISYFFSTGSTNWEPVQQVAWWQPCFINALHCFSRFSLIWAQNWVLFVFLDSLFSEEYFGKVSDFFSTVWAIWEPVLLGSSSFSVFWPPFLLWFGHLGSKALVGLF